MNIHKGKESLISYTAGYTERKDEMGITIAVGFALSPCA